MLSGNRRGRDAQPVGHSLPGAIPTLLPKLRKVAALKLFLTLLPPELERQAAPHEIRLAPAAERFGSARQEAGPQVSTLFVYTASPTVSLVLEQQAARLLAELNSKLPYPLAEALRCEPAPMQKIAAQLNNLTARPD